MPQVTKTGNYHAPVNFHTGGFWAVKVSIGGQDRQVAVFVSDPKADKHAIGTYWPAKQPGTHTGLVIDDNQFAPLYQRFGADLAVAYAQLNRGDVWIELKYAARELPDQYFAGNVGTGGFQQVQQVIVGGSVGFHQTAGFHVFINHGPY